MLERIGKTEVITPDVAKLNIDLSEGALVDLNTDELVERVVVWAQSIVGPEEFVRAKEDFYAQFGKVHPEDTFYNARMNYFLEYFVFLRPMGNSGKTPFQAWGGVADAPIHSVFQVIRHRPDNMVVRDLVSTQKYKILPRRGETFVGFGKSDIFQGFVFLEEGRYSISTGAIVHPRTATGVIRKLIKNATKGPQFSANTLLYDLAQLQIRAARHAHVNPKLLYAAPRRTL